MDQGLNWEMARIVNGLSGHSPIVDKFFIFAATDLIFVVILSAALWWLLPTAGTAGKYAALAAAGALVCGQILNLAIAHVIFVPRPFVVHPVHLLVVAAHDSSFPSDHATAAFCIAATGLIRGMPGRWLFLAGAIVIAFARVYVGAHYPLDVIVGALLGFGWAWGFFAFDSRLKRPYNLAISLAQRFHLA